MEESKNLEQNLDRSNEKLHLSDVMNSKKCWVIRDDIGQLKCVKLSLSDEDRERYRKIKWFMDECTLFE
jgi:hypothetical protein